MPSGTVTFLNGSAVLGMVSVNTSGLATLSTSSLAAGSYTVIAQYGGNASYSSSASSGLPLTIKAASLSLKFNNICLPRPTQAPQVRP